MSGSEHTRAQPLAVVLLSGGLDSMVTAALAQEAGFAVHALTVDYGQRHRLELESAARIAKQLGLVRHTPIALDLRAFGGSALTDAIAALVEEATPPDLKRKAEARESLMKVSRCPLVWVCSSSMEEAGGECGVELLSDGAS